MIVRRLIGVAVILLASSQAMASAYNLWTINRAWNDGVSWLGPGDFLDSLWTENVIWLVGSVLAIGVGAWWCRPGTMRRLEK